MIQIDGSGLAQNGILEVSWSGQILMSFEDRNDKIIDNWMKGIGEKSQNNSQVFSLRLGRRRTDG